MKLARDLIDRTRIARLLRGYRDEAPVDIDQLCQTLIQLSQLIIDIPEIAEVDINPLLADADGVLALDARIRVTDDRGNRLAIRPYPEELEEIITVDDGRKLMIRPIRPEDEPEHHAFISKLTPEDIRFRFFGLLAALPHTQMARLTQIDFDREMAFILTGKTPEGLSETLGVMRTITDPDNERCEFAIVIRSDMKGRGLGKTIFDKMIRYCRERGTRKMIGQILRDNKAMLGLAKRLGFKRQKTDDESIVEVVLDLQDGD